MKTIRAILDCIMAILRPSRKTVRTNEADLIGQTFIMHYDYFEVVAKFKPGVWWVQQKYPTGKMITLGVRLIKKMIRNTY